MTIPKQQIINTLAIILVCSFLIFIGFYFGYKSAKSQVELTVSKDEMGKIAQSLNSSTPNENVLAKEVPGVFWIKSNQEPVCPKEYPIKGTFNSNGGNYVQKTFKNYDKTRPDICFATEEFARDVVGFIKKF
jgi:DNA polymerase sigma